VLCLARVVIRSAKNLSDSLGYECTSNRRFWGLPRVFFFCSSRLSTWALRTYSTLDSIAINPHLWINSDLEYFAYAIFETHIMCGKYNMPANKSATWQHGCSWDFTWNSNLVVRIRKKAVEKGSSTTSSCLQPEALCMISQSISRACQDSFHLAFRDAVSGRLWWKNIRSGVAVSSLCGIRWRESCVPNWDVDPNHILEKPITASMNWGTKPCFASIAYAIWTQKYRVFRFRSCDRIFWCDSQMKCCDALYLSEVE
jgi:hypothetical protein